MEDHAKALAEKVAGHETAIQEHQARVFTDNPDVTELAISRLHGAERFRSAVLLQPSLNQPPSQRTPRLLSIATRCATFPATVAFSRDW